MSKKKETRHQSLNEFINTLINTGLLPSPDFYPKKEKLLELTDINSQKDRDYYIYILLHCIPEKEEDFELEDYLYSQLKNFDSAYYENAESVIGAYHNY